MAGGIRTPNLSPALFPSQVYGPSIWQTPSKAAPKMGTQQTIPTAPVAPPVNRAPSTAPRAPSGPSAEQRAASVAAATAAAATAQANANRAELANGQFKLLGGFASARDAKLGNISSGLQSQDSMLLKNYGVGLEGLEGTRSNNEMAEGDASFDNVANAVRERTSIMDQAASLGAGETDLLRSQLAALRNYSANQGEVNRSFFDTLRGINNSVNNLNSDTDTSRVNLFNQAESDRESAWANFHNQSADTWTQIQNIENSQFNDASFVKQYGQAGDEAAKAVGSSYARKQAGAEYSDWKGKGKSEDRPLTSSNKAASVNLSAAPKAPEGATLRRGAF